MAIKRERELMQAQQNQHGRPSRSLKGHQHNLLLVSCGSEMEDHTVSTTLDGQRVRLTGTSTSLLEALGRLGPEGIDVVLLGSEFREEELALFILDARRRGFAGLIAHVVSAMSRAKRSDPRHESGAGEGEGSFDQHGARDMQASPEVNKSHASIFFTPKQQDVLLRVSNGWTNKQIALDLKCTEGSVKAILQQLFNKLGVRKRAQIVRRAFEGGFPVVPR